MRYLYTLAIYIYLFAIHIACWKNKKARLWVKGRKGVFRILQEHIPKGEEHPVVWFHAASLGEFEQGRPLMEAYKKQHPETFILLTFFSPSGYEIRKNYDGADLICYLPIDTLKQARRFVSLANPSKVFFIKYEFWYNYLHFLSKTSAKVYQVSMIARPKHYLFGYCGGWFRKQLKVFHHFFVQDQTSFYLLRRHGFNNVTVAGDTRFDRVYDICLMAKTFPLVEKFIAGRKVLLSGSSWPPDEQIISKFLRQDFSNLCCILVPHEIYESHLLEIEKLFPDSIRYTALQETNIPQKSVLIVDTIGMLSGLYRYADLAYIGGGFGKGIHNVLEAAAFGIPTCFGPKYEKFKEARELIAGEGAFELHDADDLQRIWNLVLQQNKSNPDSAAAKSKNYVKKNTGASKTILSKISLSLLCGMLMVFSACSPYKHLDKGDFLLSKNKIEIHGSNVSSGDFHNLIKQDPNHTFLGMKIPMYIYSASSPGKDEDVSWLDRNVFRRLGEAPVAYRKDLSQATAEEMRTYLHSKGCFSGTVKDSLLFRKKWYMPWQKSKRRVEIRYIVHTGPRHKTDSVSYQTADTAVQRRLHLWKKKALFGPGDFYDETKLKQERSRIAKLMRQEGYFAFSENYISFEVDTSKHNHLLDISLKINLPIVLQDSIPIKTNHRLYKINNILVYPQHAISSNPNEQTDTVVTYNGKEKSDSLPSIHFIHNGKPDIKPGTIARAILVKPGALYNPETIERTYNELLSLKNFRYVDITLNETDSELKDTLNLDCIIRLQREKRHSLTNSLEANYSANVLEESSSSASGTFGVEWKVGYQHRNLFRGAEIFSTNLKAAMEVQSDFSRQEENISFWNLISAYELGGDVGLEIPRFVFPFGQKLFSRTFRPHTAIKLSYNTQRRSYFYRNIASGSFGYTWRFSKTLQHFLFPVELNFVKMNITNEDFRSLIERYDRRVQYQYTDHLVMDMSYTFVFSDKDPDYLKSHNFLRWNVEIAGNLFYLVGKVAKREKNDNGQYEVFGIPYAQYLKTDFDYRRYIPVSPKQTLVLRGFGGIGIPYGNATAMPYEKSFFSGGANNLRAWQLRQLGPGASANTSEKKLDRIGDITLGMNAEYRFPIVSILEGAAFVDAGNIWLLRQTPNTMGGKFAFDSFWKEFAVGIGLGLRINISFFIFRIDFAVKALDPSLPLGERWVLDKVQFKDIVPHFGINYPF